MLDARKIASNRSIRQHGRAPLVFRVPRDLVGICGRRFNLCPTFLAAGVRGQVRSSNRSTPGAAGFSTLSQALLGPAR